MMFKYDACLYNDSIIIYCIYLQLRDYQQNVPHEVFFWLMPLNITCFVLELWNNSVYRYIFKRDILDKLSSPWRLAIILLFYCLLEGIFEVLSITRTSEGTLHCIVTNGTPPSGHLISLFFPSGGKNTLEGL